MGGLHLLGDRGLTRRPRLAAVAIALAIAAVVPACAAALPPFTLVPDPTPPTLPAGSSVVRVADVTGSGTPDLILVNGQQNAVGVMLGDGRGGFGEASWTTVAGQPIFIAVADFNGDGHPDLMVPVRTITPALPYPNPLPDKVQILFGDGRGGFTAGSAVMLPEIGPVYAGRFDGSNEDVAVAPDGCWGRDNSDKYYTLLGDGHGDLTPGPVSEVSGEAGCESYVADFTGDGRDDLLTLLPGHVGETPELEVLPGQAGGGFGSPVLTPASALAGFGFIDGVADLNGDGIPDLIAGVGAQPMGRVAILDGNGAGGFSETGAYSSELPGAFGFGVLLGDFTGDGRTDLMTVGPQLAFREGQGDGAFGPALTLPLVPPPGRFSVADLNGDGRSDIVDVLPPSSVQVYLDEPTRTPPPVIASLRESHRRWREGRRLARLTRTGRAVLGTAFSFTLNEPATVSLVFEQRLVGHQRAHRCVAGVAARRRARGLCTLRLARGTLALAAHAGANTVVFQGRISSSRRLKPGDYTTIVSATSAAGRSPSGELDFTIVR